MKPTNERRVAEGLSGCGSTSAAQVQHKCKQSNPRGVLQEKRRDQCKVATSKRHASVDWGAFLGFCYRDPDEVDGDGVAEEHRKGEEHPGQVRRGEGKEPQKGHALVRVQPAEETPADARTRQSREMTQVINKKNVHTATREVLWRACSA